MNETDVQKTYFIFVTSLKSIHKNSHINRHMKLESADCVDDVIAAQLTRNNY